MWRSPVLWGRRCTSFVKFPWFSELPNRSLDWLPLSEVCPCPLCMGLVCEAHITWGHYLDSFGMRFSISFFKSFPSNFNMLPALRNFVLSLLEARPENGCFQKWSRGLKGMEGLWKRKRGVSSRTSRLLLSMRREFPALFLRWIEPYCASTKYYQASREAFITCLTPG